MILKKYYCTTCGKFKSRFDLKKILVGYDAYWFECKYCHQNGIMYSKDIIEKTCKYAFDEDNKLKRCENDMCDELVTIDELKKQIWKIEGVKVDIKPIGESRLVRPYNFDKLSDNSSISDLQQRISYCLSPFTYTITI